MCPKNPSNIANAGPAPAGDGGILFAKNPYTAGAPDWNVRFAAQFCLARACILARLLADADIGLMEAKRRGRNRVCVPADLQGAAEMPQ